jgi:Tol biopolymer transport system component
MKALIGFVVVVGCAAGLAALPPVEDPPQFTEWSAAVNLGPVVNSPSYDACPTISKSGTSLYFRSNRPGGKGGFDIWVAQRDSLEDSWEAPVNLGDSINAPSNEYCSAFSPDGHWMVFVSDRPGCGSQDLWLTHRKDKRNDFGWEPPVNLGCVVNSPAQENGPAFFADEATGQLFLYFSSGRPGGLGLLDIYVSEVDSEQKTFGPPSPVAELNSASTDYQPVLRKDGLEIFFASNRPGSLPWPTNPSFRYPDLWTATRETAADPWSPPVNLGSLVNSVFSDFHPTLSFDRTTLIFASERLGTTNADLYISTRTKLRGPR